LPGIDDLRDDPMGALNKGWGFLGAALGAVGKTVNE
jgi:ADP-ribosylation factor GTPase-activating protein 1